MIIELNYDNYKTLNKYFKTIFLALDSEGYIGIFEKQSRKQVSIIPFPATYDLKDFELV